MNGDCAWDYRGSLTRNGGAAAAAQMATATCGRGARRGRTRSRRWTRAAVASLEAALGGRRRSRTTSKSRRRCSTRSGTLLELERRAERVAPAGRGDHATASSGADRCHFSAPVSMPDDPAQPTGRLLLTSTRAVFAGGARTPALAWHATREVDPVRPRLLFVYPPRRRRRRPSFPLQLVRRRAVRRGDRAPPDARPRAAADYNRRDARPPRPRTAARRSRSQADRPASASGSSAIPPRSTAGSSHASDRLARRRLDAGGALRAAARLPLRPAGKHDRVAARAGREAARAGLLALQRDARADRRDARRPRRAGDRSPGRRHAHLHLHLHDGELPARRARARRPRGRLRPAQPDRRRDDRRARCSIRRSRRSSGSSRSRCATA